METNIYFIRHCESDTNIKEDRIRPLTGLGLERSKDIGLYLEDKNIGIIYSSPYKRTIDTVDYFSSISGLGINEVEDFRERKISDGWIDDFDNFSRRQWEDFDYSLEYGESLREVQERNIRSLENILDVDRGKNIVISTHGTALSTILNYYDGRFTFKDFDDIKTIMPFIVHMKFEGDRYMSREIIYID